MKLLYCTCTYCTRVLIEYPPWLYTVLASSIVIMLTTNTYYYLLYGLLEYVLE
jgi:hypothetical protein